VWIFGWSALAIGAQQLLALLIDKTWWIYAVFAGIFLIGLGGWRGLLATLLEGVLFISEAGRKQG